MKQYPHILTVETTADSSLDSSGNWANAPADEPVRYPCRAEPATTNGLVKTADGGTVNYGWIIYTKEKPALSFGQKVSVFASETLLLTDTVKQYSEGQLNTRTWL